MSFDLGISVTLTKSTTKYSRLKFRQRVVSREFTCFEVTKT